MDITIAINDWLEEYQREHADVSSEEAVIALLLSAGCSTAKVARFVLVARELGQTQEDIVRVNKLLLQSGARADIAALYKQAKVKVTTDAGTELEIRAYVGKTSDQEEAEAELVSAQSQEGLDRAVRYCLNTISGHTFGRWKIIAAHDPELLVEVAEQMKANLDEMLERLRARVAQPAFV